jgi:glycine cleavage system H lipoate-binding protein
MHLQDTPVSPFNFACFGTPNALIKMPARESKQSAADSYRRLAMTVLLVLATFAIFLTIDHFYAKAKHPALRVAPAMTKQAATAPALKPSPVGGFDVPDNRRYHPGHTWALGESPNLVRIGIDDFASKLVGKVEHVMLPQRGQWIRQGQKVWTIVRNGVKVDMVSPIEGSVSDINEAVVKDPSLATKDPYGEGWMVTVQSPDSKTNFRNLLGGALARWWTEESSMRLQRVMPSALGALAQDGGVAMDDLASTMPDEQWTKVTREFFLT